jgi:hypothetical protein
LIGVNPHLIKHYIFIFLFLYYGEGIILPYLRNGLCLERHSVAYTLIYTIEI